MMLLPIYFHASIPLQEIEEALHAKGLHLRNDGRGRILANRVPRSLVPSPETVPRRSAELALVRAVRGTS